MSNLKEKIGLIEKITVYGKKGQKTVWGKFDTGAKLSSIDEKLAEEVGVGDSIKYTKIKSASNASGSRRMTVELEVKIKGSRYKTLTTITDRSRMKFPLLLGRDLIHSNFIIDVQKSHHTPSERDYKC